MLSPENQTDAPWTASALGALGMFPGLTCRPVPGQIDRVDEYVSGGAPAALLTQVTAEVGHLFVCPSDEGLWCKAPGSQRIPDADGMVVDGVTVLERGKQRKIDVWTVPQEGVEKGRVSTPLSFLPSHPCTGSWHADRMKEPV